MSLSVKTTYLNTLSLKCLALIFGYGLWHCVSMHHKIQITRNIPVCFYNTRPDLAIAAPESISVTCYGTRKNLFKTAFDSAIHFDAQTVHVGTQKITVQREQIFLPESVSLVHYQPTDITVVATETVQPSNA